MSEEVIIIGAGITGLVTGILLRQQGYNVKILEKQSHIIPIGGGLGVWPIGVRILMNLPCKDKITQLPGMITHDVFGDADGNTLMESPRELFLQVNGFPIMNVCRSELHQILLDEFGRENITFGTKCIDIHQQLSRVTAYFDNQTSIEADFIIGADGTYSTVRKKLFPQTKLTYSGYLHLLGVLRYPSHQKPRHHFIFGKNRYCLQFPIANKRHIFYQVLPYSQGAIQGLKTREERISLFKGWSYEVDTLLKAYENSLIQTEFNSHFYCEESYTMPPLQKWHEHRVILIGDAAHPIGSIYGLGAGCGLEDSFVLTSNLKNKKFAEAVNDYEKKQMRRMEKFYQLEKNFTDFILQANEEEYNLFIKNFKKKSPIEANQELIHLLKQ